ncbi:DUF952 domain-containing protein [Paenibacillus dakarensis]|uniref:DUF952 domain-containing protein n=1 Tax=Paenibacillus dakarensis TaxID=1527293 RepID=UPI0006D5A145|nr:DUF952 domain-containing protein [Paenibacillus dakarensis]
MIMHIMKYTAMKQILLDGVYTPSSLEKEGFIHCSTPEQLLGVANSLYKGETGLMLMLIDENKVEADIVYEDLYDTGKLFPHIYGPINFDAVIRMVEFTPTGVDGSFKMPEGVME